ncbi:unnamed protein product (macronuclear) [Paramecium tetraurelia]|uniref:RING-type domain-containing protein n=1 Tax=Paramecium tetraurelia TaxID=5888 RepID=A0BY79_PARTE|nr:uncharacterized protein GSPATT00033349001 [Paramecium tetraurelia]CAK63496.1 unnamed protein product [Paramecium tetraurelia]|eukprot:XP_001430894.1 hypothetical protein (macronuclear) [Paramecium tetraurelia strain d4-2]
MSTYNRYYCTSCYSVWDENQCVPKILDCGHSFCLKCLKRLLQNDQIICPEDMKCIKINSLNQLRTNEELLHPQPQRSERILPSTHSSQQDISVTKSETVTQSTTRLFINVPDNSVSIRKPQQVYKKEQIPWTREQLQQCHQQLQEYHQQFELNQMIIQQKRTLIEQIQQKFSDFQIKLKNIESQLLYELNIMTFDKSISPQTKSQLLKSNQPKKVRIEQLLLLSNEKLNAQVDLVNTLTQQTEQLITSLSKQETLMVHDLINKEMQIQFDLTVYDYLPQFCTIKKYENNNNRNQLQNKSQTRVKTLNDSNSNNCTNKSNQSLSFTSSSPKPKVRDNSSSKPFQYSKNAHHIEESPSQRQNPRELTFGPSVQLRRSHDSRNASPNNKLYEATGIDRLEELLFKGLPIEKLDLTNQNLNDQDVQELIKLVQQSTSQIEILKLGKNRISDIGFDKLLTLLLKRSDIHTLNLSNNDCTVKSIDMIERRIQKLYGKTIYLSNCKLNNLTQLKKKQTLFQNKGVTLFL